MKVLVVSNMYPSEEHPAYGGFVKSQVEQLRAGGIEVDLAVITDRRKGFVANIRKYLLLFFAMVSAIGRKYDVYHVHYLFPTGLIVLPVALVTRTPVVLTAHGGDVLLGQRRQFRFLTKLTLSFAKGVIAVSESLAGKINKSFGVDIKKITVASCGVDLDLFSPRDKRKSRAALGVPAETKLVLFVGNLVPVKGIENLLQSFAWMAKDEPLAQLALMGEGPLRDELQELAVQLGIENSCRWLTPVEHDQVPAIISAADLLVLPSLHEGFGLVALEALACGVPVVASRTGGLPEIVTDGKNGLLVEPGDKIELAAAMSRLLKDDSLRKKYGKAGRTQVQKHCKEQQLAKINRVYDLAAASRQQKNTL
ncbi:MAG: glycosyltransferase [Dethiobacter sp.]|nr:glycosyltransferase [Dethiobacter sp.]